MNYQVLARYIKHYNLRMTLSTGNHFWKLYSSAIIKLSDSLYFVWMGDLLFLGWSAIRWVIAYIMAAANINSIPSMILIILFNWLNIFLCNVEKSSALGRGSKSKRATLYMYTLWVSSMFYKSYKIIRIFIFDKIILDTNTLHILQLVTLK